MTFSQIREVKQCARVHAIGARCTEDGIVPARIAIGVLGAQETVYFCRGCARALAMTVAAAEAFDYLTRSSFGVSADFPDFVKKKGGKR